MGASSSRDIEKKQELAPMGRSYGDGGRERFA